MTLRSHDFIPKGYIYIPERVFLKGLREDLRRLRRGETNIYPLAMLRKFYPAQIEALEKSQWNEVERTRNREYVRNHRARKRMLKSNGRIHP